MNPPYVKFNYVIRYNQPDVFVLTQNINNVNIIK